jgi:hypothetical protein
MYHTILLLYRLGNKGPGFWARHLFEHLVYRVVFAWLLYLSSFFFNVGRPTDSYLQFNGTGQEEDGKKMGFLMRILYGTVAQTLAEKMIKDRSPWECMHAAFWKSYSVTAVLVGYGQSVFWWVVDENLRPWLLIFGYEIRVPKLLLPYEYAELKLGQMRVLEIYRNKWFRVCYSLHVVPTTHEWRYEAISYAWGEDKTKEVITISERSFETTKTVGNILRRRSKLWGGLWPGTRRLIWLDSICINQKDVEERSLQVQGMRDIYSRARKVMVCLGGEDREDATLAGWLLIKLHTLSLLMSPEELAKRCMTDRHTPSWEALSRLLAHPWFSRVWIIQEIAVAQDVFVTYGGGLLNWDIISWALIIFSRPEMASMLSTSTEEMRIGIPRSLIAGIIVSIVRHRTQINEGLRLRDGVMMCSKCEATDPRDKILALFGLITDELNPYEWINYKISTEGLYLKVALYFLSEPENPLQILSYAGIGYDRNAKLDLPSWIPDWSCIPKASSFVGGIQVFPYRGCGVNTLNARSFSVSGNHLTIQAKQIDTIAYLAPEGKIFHNSLSNEELENIYQFRFTWLQTCLDLTNKHCPDPYYNGQPITEAFWRCLVGDRTVEGRPAPQEYADWYEAFETVCLRPPGEEKSFDFIADLLARSHKYEAPCAASLLGRRFCISANGFMGLAPPGTKSGDEVWVSEGVETLLLVRGKAGVKSLVGESFMMGCMDGEGAAGGDWESLHLC